MWLLGCGAQRPAIPPPASAEHPVELDTAARQASEVYRVASEDTDIRVLVYRAGRLSALGHNHVVAAKGVDGRIYRHPDARRSSFDLTIPVEMLSVDEPALRREAGEGFSSEPSEADAAGTRRNMLGPRVLDAAGFPSITLAGRLAGAGGQSQAEITLGFQGRRIPLSVPIVVALEGTTLTVSGTFDLTHAELGLEPFSVMLGAIQVAETLHVEFRVVARKEPAS